MSQAPTWQSYRVWLAETLKGELPTSTPSPEPSKFSTDSRTLRPGDWFVPIKGENFDGHEYIDAAMGAGSAGFLYNAGYTGFSKKFLKQGVAVTNTLTAFQAIAAGWRKVLPLNLLALTGSSGKTTTKEMLSLILDCAGPSLTTHGSFNNEIGVPKTLLRLKHEHKYAALEFGARHVGDIKFLLKLAAPSIAACLNIGKTHVGEFGSLKALVDTKLEMFNDAGEATLVALYDDKRILECADSLDNRTITFGRSEKADVFISDIKEGVNGAALTVTLGHDGERSDVNFMVSHETWPINAAAAAALALAAGIPLFDSCRALCSFTGVSGRYKVIETEGNTVIDDSYNANPDSMLTGLASLVRGFSKRQKVLVLGDMLELGTTSQKEHYEIGRYVARRVKPKYLLVVGKEAVEIAKGAETEGYDKDKIETFDNVQGVIDSYDKYISRKDVVYVKASNAVGLTAFVKFLGNLK